MSYIYPLFISQALAVLGVEDEHAAVKNMENSLVWLARACPIKELVMMLSFSISRRKTESQKVLFSEVCKALERRWVEIKGKFGSVLASIILETSKSKVSFNV